MLVFQQLIATPFYINHIPVDFNILSFSVMPSDSLLIELNKEDDLLYFKSNEQDDIKAIEKEMIWVAPKESGLYILSFFIAKETYTIPVFVMRPLATIKEISTHFPLGEYQNSTFKGLEQYRTPQGMIEVTKENQNTFVSPHFRLKDFLTKQNCDFPKYLILSSKLLYKLELLIDTMKNQGVKVDNMHIMSGYRTPVYNKGLGNVNNSRHVFGDAADIFVDNDNNQKMDDLTNDGYVDIKDAKFLASYVEQIENDHRYRWLAGGLGVYKKNGAHAGFIHMDTRGYPVKW